MDTKCKVKNTELGMMAKMIELGQCRGQQKKQEKHITEGKGKQQGIGSKYINETMGGGWQRCRGVEGWVG